jgi:uncharacterized protein (TIGR02246 family)
MVLGGVGLMVTASSAQVPGKAAAPGRAAAPGKAAAPAPPSPGARPAAEEPRENPVRDVMRAFSQAYSAGDSKALAGLFVDGALVVDPSGGQTQGKAAISDMYAASMKDAPGLKLESETDRVQFLTPSVARIEGRSRIFATTGSASEFTQFNALLVQSDGKWRLAEIREQPAALQDVSPYQRLQELEWMVGDWVDESESSRVVVDIHWTDNQSYLVRNYKVELQGEKAHSGTMFIGWDPLTEQIKSWVFDSEGGHGEGFWTRTSDTQWIVKASGVLHDGRPTSATHIHTIVNKDAVKTSSIDRIIGGQIAPDIVDIVMVRKPPQPASAAPRPAPATTQPNPRGLR